MKLHKITLFDHQIKWFNLMAVLLGFTLGLMATVPAHAATILDVLTDIEGRYTGPTVEENVVSMDTDKNGFADASEVRAFLELKHGKGYESEVLDRFEASLKGTSCGTPFAGVTQLTN